MKCTRPRPLKPWKSIYNSGNQVSPTIYVDCGKCLNCKINKAREWTTRLIHETNISQSTIFITLTYDTEHLPPEGVRKSDVQDFISDLRKVCGPGIRYFIGSEYGDSSDGTHRPHYHASFSTPPIGSKIPLVQVLIEWKRDSVKQIVEALSTPIITIFGDEDLSQSESSTLVEQAISHITTWIKQMLPRECPQISPSCLNDLVSVLTSMQLYQTKLLPESLSLHTLEQLSPSLDTIDDSDPDLPESPSTPMTSREFQG